MRILAAAFAATLLCACADQPAPQDCADARVILGRLALQYNEHPVVMGMEFSGNILEVTAAPDGSSWTMLSTDNAGRACMVRGGQFLRIRQPGGR